LARYVSFFRVERQGERMNEILEMTGILVTGLLARLLLLVVFLAVLALPLVAGNALYESLKRLHRRRHGLSAIDEAALPEVRTISRE
jgi:hypothetical protein